MATDKTKLIAVGGGLHSIATGNMLAVTDEILDDTYNKRLSEINKELNNKSTDLQNSIDTEASRAKLAEAALQTNIDAEKNRATTAETTLQANINQETDRAKAAEATLNNNLATETTARLNADTTLLNNIDAEVSRAKGAEATLLANIDTEKNRATTAENTLQTNINQETDRAKAAEKVNSDAIAAEADRAKKAEAANTAAITKEVSDRTTAINNLQGQINNISSAYKYVSDADSKQAILDYSKTHSVRVGDVINYTGATLITWDGKAYSSGTNFAAKKAIANGTAGTEQDWDALGGMFDMSAVNNSIDVVKKVVWNNHASASISASPNPIEKGVNTNVTVSWRGTLAGFANPTVTYVVKKNGNQWTTEGTSKQEALNSEASYHVDATIEGTVKGADVTVRAYYPIYTFASSAATITALPEGASKYGTIVSAPNITVSTVLAANQYFCIAVPDGMKISGALTNSAAGSAPANMVAAGDITVTGKGTYHCYRSSMTQVAGTYSITYKG